jgi:uncharacterized protein (DUF1800 family)
MNRLTTALWALTLAAPLAAQAPQIEDAPVRGVDPIQSDLIFGRLAGNFESNANAPANDAEAARFLTQATFGPTVADIALVKSLGYPAWIDDQLTRPATLQRPEVEIAIAAAALTNPMFGGGAKPFRIERWFQTAIYGPDQLRQRMAFALSQVMVVSDVGGLDGNPITVAEYSDILVRNALGRYRNLLREVTYSPAMGNYLTHLRNRKTDWSLNGATPTPDLIAPDENYAREIMQLFSIGLIERNRNFTPILINNQPVPTYSQALITETAKALTGLAYGCSGNAVVAGIAINRNCGGCVGPACNFSNTLFNATPPRYVTGTAPNVIITALTHPDAYNPLVCYPRYADTGRYATAATSYAVLPAPNNIKYLLAGIQVQPSPVGCYTATPAGDRQACIDYCTNQIDTVVESLFQHPNAAPMMARQLIQRLTTSNPSANYIDRVAQAFENDGQGNRGNLAAVARAILLDPEARANVPSAEFGKVREPLLRLTAIWRSFGAVVGASNGQLASPVPERFFAQRPLGAPTVFNFYEPDYAQPGEIQNAGLYSPEFQILNESTAITAADELWRRVFAGYSFSGSTLTNYTQPPNTASLPATEIDALPADGPGLVDELNRRLLFGQMSASTRGKLIQLADVELASTDKRRKALNLIHLIAISPEFAVQR